jgi:hypothetical protein
VNKKPNIWFVGKYKKLIRIIVQSIDIKMAPPCKRYRKVYTWQVFSIRHIINIAEFATLGGCRLPAILENRGGKSHFCDYFIYFILCQISILYVISLNPGKRKKRPHAG